MPDQFGGDPAPNTVPEPTSPSDMSMIEKFKLGLVDAVKSFTIDMWLARHTPERVLPILHKVLDAAKEEFADAIANGGGVYAVGYCFGAKYVLLLAGENPDKLLWMEETPGQAEEGKIRKGPFIKAGAVAHGTQVTPDDIGAVKVPMSIICVEDDPLFPDEIRQAGEDILGKSGVEHEVKVYPGVPHGFAVLGDYPDSKIKEAQQQAFAEMLGWLQAH
jgi:dienelactone hydrolase